jgi:hypothetical protein
MFSAERPFAFRNHQDAREKVTAKVKTNTVPSGFVFAGSKHRSPFAFGSVLDDALNKDYRDIVMQCAAEQPHPSDQFIDGVVHR